MKNGNKNQKTSCNAKPSTIRAQWIARIENHPVMQADMNRLVMDYFIKGGFTEAAENFQVEAGLAPIELNALNDRVLIREEVQSGRIESATNMVNQLHSGLLDTDSYLSFHMQQLQLIELIRDGKVAEALTFAQNKLSKIGEKMPEVLNELESTLALLAFEKPEDSPFADLLEQPHRQKIASELNAAILKYEHGSDSEPKIIFLIKLIAWAQSKLNKAKVILPRINFDAMMK